MEKCNRMLFQGRTQELIKALEDVRQEVHAMLKQKPHDAEKVKTYYQLLAQDIVRQKQRLGGSFTVAHVLPTKELRDHMKETFGSQVIFVALHLSKETNSQRVEARHAGGDKEMKENVVKFLTALYDAFEDAQPGEKNCITVHVEPDDSREDVMQKILNQIEEIEG